MFSKRTKFGKVVYDPKEMAQFNHEEYRSNINSLDIFAAVLLIATFLALFYYFS